MTEPVRRKTSLAFLRRGEKPAATPRRRPIDSKAIEMRRYLRGLTSAVDQALTALDVAMAKPSTPERGRRIATIANRLQLANDNVKRFGLR